MVYDKKRPGLDDLVALMKTLRSAEGCPWDREQTPESLTPYIMEEACELVDAIKGGDPGEVGEELGDLLFQIVFQAEIASERGLFEMGDVIEGIHDKMTRRHPHVFGDAHVKDSAEVRKRWVRLKQEEGKKAKDGVLGRVPRSLPALLRGRRLTENAAEAGFDWPRVEEVLSKFEEEWQELKDSVERGARADVEDEFGDILFVLVNLSRFMDLDPERALGSSIEKFVRRFNYMEEKAMESGRKLESFTLDEMEELWQEAKTKGL